MIATKTAKVAARTIRWAIYARKSSEEGLAQEFNSLDAQRESAGGVRRLGGDGLHPYRYVRRPDRQGADREFHGRELQRPGAAVLPEERPSPDLRYRAKQPGRTADEAPRQ